MGLDSIVDTLMAPEYERSSGVVGTSSQIRKVHLSPKKTPTNLTKRKRESPSGTLAEDAAPNSNLSRSHRFESPRSKSSQEGESYQFGAQVYFDMNVLLGHMYNVDYSMRQ